MSYFNAYHDTNGDTVYVTGPIPVVNDVSAPVADRDAGRSAGAADNLSLSLPVLDWHDRAKFVSQLHAFQLGIADAIYHLNRGADDQYALAVRALDTIARHHNIGLKACILAYVGTQLPRPAGSRDASVYRGF